MLKAQRGGLESLRHKRIVLEIDANAAAAETAKVAFLTLCNLSTRLGPYAPQLDISVPDGIPPLDSFVYPCGESLKAQALRVLRGSTSIDDLSREIATSDQPYDIALSIGVPQLRATRRLYIGWHDWLALVTEEPSSLGVTPDGNVMGGMVAAAMATARLHALQLAQVGVIIPHTVPTWRLNALTLSGGNVECRLPAGGIRLPRLLLVGAGALGSSLCYALTHFRGIEAEVDAVDADVLKPANANRQITAPFEDSRTGTVRKVDDLARIWRAVHPLPLTYSAFKEHYGRSARDYEVAICAVDNKEARRDVARDLPRVLIDGATGGQMIALMRGANPIDACVACAYPDVATDEISLWSRRLGLSQARTMELRASGRAFTEIDIECFIATGTHPATSEIVDGLRREGWGFLSKAPCGNAIPDRQLPVASVSYVSALCGFLMASQVIAEVLECPSLARGRPRWEWDDVLRTSPLSSAFVEGGVSQQCAARHNLRSRIYRENWATQSG